ncbi:MAG: hypothetical protein ACYTX0_60790, partial [Nostoc sp.]
IFLNSVYQATCNPGGVGAARTSLRDPSLRDAARTASSGHRAPRTASSVTIVDIAKSLLLVKNCNLKSQIQNSKFV